jgi:hypothetical protein
MSGDVIVIKRKIRLFSLLALSVYSCIPAVGQGCVAAHSNQRVISELVRTDGEVGDSLFSIHNLTVGIGYRVSTQTSIFKVVTRLPDLFHPHGLVTPRSFLHIGTRVVMGKNLYNHQGWIDQGKSI